MDFSGFNRPAFGSTQTGGPMRNPMARNAPPAAPPKKKNFWLDQISTAGGIAGGVLGTLVAPVVGTAAGGALGAGLGESLENFLAPGTGNMGNVAKEAALGGLFAGGPIKLGKAALGARTALKTGAATGLKEAVKMGGEEAAKFTVRGALGNKLQNSATGLATKQFGLTGNFVSKYGTRYGEDAGKTITRYGIQTADDATAAIAKQNTIFDDLVQNAGTVKKTTLQKNLDTAADDLLKQMPTDQKLMGQKVIGEASQLMDNFGDDISAIELNTIRKQYDKLVTYSLQQADPAKHGVNKRVADTLRETIQTAAGGQLKETGKEISKLITLSDEISKRAATVANRGASPFGLRNLVGAGAGASAGAGIGGVAGGPIGALAGMGLTAAANSPGGRRMATNTALNVGGKLARSGAKAAPNQMSSIKTAMRVGVPGLVLNPGSPGDPTAQGNAQSLEGAMTDDSQNFGVGAFDNQQEQQNNMGGQLDPQTLQPMNSPQEQVSPYGKQNLLSDINRDPQNAAKYIGYYQQLDEIFNPNSESNLGRMAQMQKLSGAGGGKSLTEGQQMRADLIKALDLSEGAVQQGSINYGPVGSRVEGFKSVFNQADPETLSFKNTVSGLKGAIAKARAGASMSEGEKALLMQYTPSDTDSEQVVRSKLQSLRNLYGFDMPTGGGFPETLQDVFSNQQGAYN